MQDGAAFWDRVADRYARRAISDVPAFERTLDLARARLSPTDRVLEIGCGTGTAALRLASSVADYTATDFSGAMIGIAEARRREAGTPNLRVLRAAAGEAPQVAGGYDAVVAFNLLHLVPDLPATLAAVAERLRPGGLLISKTICLGDARWRVRAVVRALRLAGVVPDMRALRIAELDGAIAAAGFRILETDVLPKSPPARFVVAARP